MKRPEKESSLFENIDWNKWLGIGIALMILGFILAPIGITQMSWGVDYSGTGPIGDTIGGIMGPLVGSVGGLLTFMAFKVQYEANQQQKRDLQIERFESRLFAMLDMHRKNVNETCVYYAFLDSKQQHKNLSTASETVAQSVSPLKARIYELQGQAAFDFMSFEFRHLYWSVLCPLRGQNGCDRDREDKTDDQLFFDTAWAVFYFGTTFTANNLIDTMWKNGNKFYEIAQDKVKSSRKKVLKKLEVGSPVRPYGELYAEDLSYKSGKRVPVPMPTAGHSYVLSHYYRHLLAMILYIDKMDSNVLNEQQKMDYATLVRAQLSVPEQHLLLCYALSPMGKRAWLEDPMEPLKDSLLKKYRLVKNIHFPIVQLHKTPPEVLGIEFEDVTVQMEYFNWLDTENRP